MAVSGGVDPIVQRMVEVARAMVPGRDVGPVISAAAKARITRYIDEAEAAVRTVARTGIPVRRADDLDVWG